MENVRLRIYQSLIDVDKTSALELMRSREEFLDFPGYEFTRIIRTCVREGYIDQFEGADKMYYSATEKARALLKQLENAEKAKEESEAKQRKRKERKRKTAAALIVAALSVVCAMVIVANTIIIPGNNYTAAMGLMTEGKYEEAMAAFDALGDYKDAKQKSEECHTAWLEEDYNAAISFMASGDYSAAITAFRALDYKDSAEKADECMYVKQVSAFTNVKVGDYVKFGEYEQDNNKENGKEEIEWLVLDKKGDKYWLISRYALDKQPYNSSFTDVTWETCSLRKWMNFNFCNNAFSQYHLANIQTTHVTADINPAIIRNPDTPLSHKGITPGNDTKDKIFLLSGKEAEEVLPAEKMQAFMTEYADPERDKLSADYCYWWLRTPAWTNQDFAMYFDDGANCSGRAVCPDRLDIYVRPSMWIELSE